MIRQESTDSGCLQSDQDDEFQKNNDNRNTITAQNQKYSKHLEIPQFHMEPQPNTELAKETNETLLPTLETPTPTPDTTPSTPLTISKTSSSTAETLVPTPNVERVEALQTETPENSKTLLGEITEDDKCQEKHYELGLKTCPVD